MLDALRTALGLSAEPLFCQAEVGPAPPSPLRICGGRAIEVLDLVVLAAGRGTRAQRSAPKQFVDLCGKPMIIYSLEVFEGLPYIGTKYVTCTPDDMGRMHEVLSEYRISDFVLVEGGTTRAESVWNGLVRVQTERVVTHNAAVPFVTKRLVDQVVAEIHDCVTTATPMPYNLCEGEHFAERIVPRARLKLINTPQCFRTQAFRECHERARREGFVPTSDCELMLRYGRTVRLVPGTPQNFKITTPLDMAVAETMLRDPGFLEATSTRRVDVRSASRSFTG